VSSPAAWGTEARLKTLFPDVAAIEATPRHFMFRYRSIAHWLDVFRNFYGPVHKAFLALEPARQAELEQALTELLTRMRRDDGPGLVVPSDYLEIVIRR
jgi:hypothetical protein